MDSRLIRAYLVELVGTFAFVFFAAGLACVNVMTQAVETSPGSTPLTTQQPGLMGVALGQALVWVVLVAWSSPVSGGYLNPAIAIMRWVSNRLSTDRLAWFLGAQIIGGVAAVFVLQWIFDSAILRTAQFGAPYLNPLAFGSASQSAVWAGTAIELLLTFFLVLAMYTTAESATSTKTPAPWMSGGVMAAAVLFAGPLTGACLNPARWIGSAFWEMLYGSDSSIGRQALIYIAGPIAGALLAGAFAARIYVPAKQDSATNPPM